MNPQNYNQAQTIIAEVYSVGLTQWGGILSAAVNSITQTKTMHCSSYRLCIGGELTFQMVVDLVRDSLYLLIELCVLLTSSCTHTYTPSYQLHLIFI